ncbi:serine/threonine-protein phosphatase [Leptospira gomenensis]|uniref:Serine/threonine-protein phosphatase n=2 Tax=Leptospira gomenensis TaxID=2484974 RepID=A0A5F1YH46_9LEPT|nr:serine/threonine-protein phosphatase [Leptospira gomenensis]TGK39262.1 serine/threonine-protein phosphatase [Leptospira gomenensis]TGK48967.1 serine/threonine-protein phosphatase [Leptospira gomenensis]TGK54677.1 serine/threonine-protein phosphatase [Leptospira gomenensis]
MKTIVSGIFLLCLIVSDVFAGPIDPQRIESLNEGWEYYDASGSKLPGILIGVGLTNQGLEIPIRGFYKIEVLYPESFPSGSQGIFLDRIQSADKVYFNDKLLGGTGEIDPYSPAWFRSRLYKIPLEWIERGKTNVIRVEIRCEEYGFHCGIFRGIPKLGDFDELKDMLIQEDAFQLVLIVLFLGVFLQQSISYSLNRYSRASIFLSLSAFLFVFWRLPLLHKVHYVDIPFGFLSRSFFFSQTVFPSCILYFLYALFRRKTGWTAKLILKSSLAVAVLHLLELNGTHRVILVYVWEGILVLLGILLVPIFYTELRRKVMEAMIMVGGVGLLAVFAIIDIVLDNLTGRNMFLSQYGFFALLISGAVSISYQNARAHSELKKLNLTLEAKVDQRTEELKRQNRVLHEELEMAANLQTRLIPRLDGTIHRLSVNSVYIPVDQVGGDFLDYHILNEKKIMFILCDVLGHGVASALVSSMLKVSFLELSRKWEEPSQILSELNDRMFQVLEKNFISAFVCLYDLEKDEFRYSVAGHPPPVLLRESVPEPEFLKGRGMILGMVKKIEPATYTISLKSGDRFFFYTDGVTEALSPEREIFGEQRLLEVLKNNFSRNPRNLNEEILSTVRSFSSSKIPDDLTYLTVDIL